MAKDLNRCDFIGRLGRDVETRFTQGGKAIASFSIACGESYKDKSGQKVDRTEWINIVAFDKLAEICAEYLRKGSKVYISGQMRTRKWEKDGIDRYSTEIIAKDMQMLDSRGSGDRPQEAQHSQEPSQPQGGFDDFDDQEIPF